MDKYTEKNETYSISPETALMLLKKGHKLLPANRGQNYRKKLYSHLNRIVRPRVEEGTWKKRFNTPETNVPKKQAGELLPIMVESIMFIIQQYQDDCEGKRNDLNDAIQDCSMLINIYKEG